MGDVPKFTSGIIVSSLLLTIVLGGPASAVDYPSWDDVQAARESQAATEAAIAEIEGYLVTLESAAVTLGRAAQVKAEEYNAAREALVAASARAERLDDKAREAERTAEISNRRAGQLVAQIARTGGGGLTLDLMLSPRADDLLSSLGTISKLTEQSTALYRRATIDRNLAQSLTDQARVAEADRTRSAQNAKQALDDANRAADEARTQLEQQQAASQQLYAQLASLKGTTAEVEADYLTGLTAEKEDAEQPPAPPAPPTPPNPTPPPPSSSAVAGAIAFARAQIGDRYQFAGSGPDRWDCSGLTKGAYASVGVFVGAHYVSSQYYTMSNAGRLVPLNAMVPGDLIFYANGGSATGGFYHVALFVGNGQMIEAPREGVPVRITAVRYYDVLPYAGRPTP